MLQMSAKTQHLHYQDGLTVIDMWVQEGIPPYGMVKSLSQETETVLLGYGTVRHWGQDANHRDTPEN